MGMGGYIGTGVAQFHANRLLSLTIGGWSVEPPDNIMKSLKCYTVDFANVLLDSMAKSEDPGRIVAKENKPATRAAWSQMSDIAGSKTALKSVMESGIQLQLWVGK